MRPIVVKKVTHRHATWLGGGGDVGAWSTSW